MKKLLIILNLVSLNIFSQIVFVEGSDSLIISKINKYRSEIGTPQMNFDITINSILIKKLEWMSKKPGLISHKDPWGLLTQSSKEISKKNSTPDTTCWCYFSGEILTYQQITVDLKDTLKIKKIIFEQKNKITDDAITAWKESSQHKSIMITNTRSGKTIGSAFSMVNLNDYFDSLGKRSYAVISIAIILDCKYVSASVYKPNF